MTTTVWILNLAFADLLYCLFYLSIFVVTPSWIFGGTSCRFFAFFYTSAKLTAWMSVAMVAFNRCVIVSNLGSSNFLSSRRNQVLIMIFLRIYGFICTLPTAFGVSKIESQSPSQSAPTILVLKTWVTRFVTLKKAR